MANMQNGQFNEVAILAKILLKKMQKQLSLLCSHYYLWSCQNSKFPHFSQRLLKHTKKLDPIKRNFYDKKKMEFKVEEVDVWLDAPIPPIPGSDKWEEEKY